MKIKPKMDKWNLIKCKSFCIPKETISKTKIQPSEWKKISANKEIDKGFISKIYKQFEQFNIRKKKKVNKWVEEINIHFSKKSCRWPTNT